MRHLILNLESPLMAFGGETVDNLGVIRRFPAVSMLTGLLANALGWRRVEGARHQRLQDRAGVRRPHRPRTPRRRAPDGLPDGAVGRRRQGLDHSGEPDGRAGGANTYNAPHLRRRDYFPDLCVTVALRLRPEDDSPTLDELAVALQEPARPLFIGRKPCLPSAPLFADFTDGDTALAALQRLPLRYPGHAPDPVPLQWPRGEGVEELTPTRTLMVTDQRNWVSGLHGGGRAVCEGAAPPDQFPAPDGSPAASRQGEEHQ